MEPIALNKDLVRTFFREEIRKYFVIGECQTAKFFMHDIGWVLEAFNEAVKLELTEKSASIQDFAITETLTITRTNLVFITVQRISCFMKRRSGTA